MSILCSGEAAGDDDGAAAGVCIPGMFSIGSGDAEGCVDAAGKGSVLGAGVSFMSMPGMSSCCFACGLTAVFLFDGAGFGFGLGLGFGLFMPGMFDIS
jgi:hypothetical protein